MAETLTSIMRSRRAISAELKDVNDYLQVALENMACGLSMFDDRQRLVLCNPLYGTLYEIPETLLRPGTPLAKIIDHYMQRAGDKPHADNSGELEWIRKEVSVLAQGKLRTRTQVLFNGHTVRISTQPLTRGGWVDIIEDISEDRAREAKLAHLACHDSLTGLANRMKFRDSLEQALAGENGREMELHIINVGNFQAIRQRVGLVVRDAFISALSKTLRTATSDGDTVARLDGDIFVVLRPATESRDAAESWRHQLEKVIAGPYHVYGHELDGGIEIAPAIPLRDARETDQAINAALQSLPVRQ